MASSHSRTRGSRPAPSVRAHSSGVTTSTRVPATAADVAAAAGADVEVVTPEEWARTDGAALDPRVRGWLLAMFAYYERHGLPVGTLPMRTLLGRAPSTLAAALAPR